MNKKIVTVDELTDHDLLISLKTEFGLFAKQYTIDIKELKDGTAMKIADHEKRINDIEKIRDELKPYELTKELHGNTQWIESYKITNRLILASIGFISMIGGIIGTMIAIWSGLVKLAPK